MPVSRYRYRIMAGLATAALAVVAACHTDTGTAPQNPALTAAQAQSLGEAMTADAQSELEGITLSGGGSFAPGMAAAALGADPASCSPTISPQPVTNADGDRVPDSIRVSFPGCGFAEGDEADTIRGTIDVVDPTRTDSDGSVRTRFTDFTRIEVENGRERSIVLNGTREARRDATVISQSETNFQTVYTFGDGHTASSNRNWNATFTADVPGSIQPDQPLPSGTLSIAGTATWTRDATTLSVTASTDPVLHYNASCTVRPKFDSGTLHLTVTRNGATSTVTIQFTACGQYTVTRS